MNQIDRTISFRQDMIDLILAGKKTVTIRPIKPQPILIAERLFDSFWQWEGMKLSNVRPKWMYNSYPHGKIGDVVSIRERPGTQLKITDIWTDKLQSIRSGWRWDGVKLDTSAPYDDELPRIHWNSFYAGTEYEWVKNPWVWIIEFELINKGAGK
jgi:hypothetical protein